MTLQSNLYWAGQLTLVHRRRGDSSPFLLIFMRNKLLSVFIDESGDFGPYEKHNPYYIVALITHDQSIDITREISQMNDYMKQSGRSIHAIHVGPLIRRESIYLHELAEERKHLFNLLFNFTRRISLKYMTCCVKKNRREDEIDMTIRLAKEMAKVLRSKSDYFNSFDKIVVYYDNGQIELTKIISSLFNALFSNVEMRKVKPIDYKLFQVADLVCTMELLAMKAEQNSFSNSEIEFFGNVRNFKKDYLKTLRKKRMD